MGQFFLYLLNDNYFKVELGAIQCINIIDKQISLTNNSNSKDGLASYFYSNTFTHNESLIN
jgi:hypothetical protein